MVFSRRESAPRDVTTTSGERQNVSTSPEGAISIVGPGMRVVGDLETDGTIRIEGTVEGSVRAGKAVVVGKDGMIEGDVRTQDAVIAGRVAGTVIAGSRLELQATSRIDGEVFARKIQLEEGGVLNGAVHMTENPSHVVETRDVGLEGAAPIVAEAPN